MAVVAAMAMDAVMTDTTVEDEAPGTHGWRWRSWRRVMAAVVSAAAAAAVDEEAAEAEAASALSPVRLYGVLAHVTNNGQR